jgi:acetyl esterase/lipase
MRITHILLLAALVAPPAPSQTRVEKNVVYGMYSGLAVLMDIHRPAQPNGYALIVIPGSGWNSSQAYNAQPLTALVSSVRFFVPKLLESGYTLFVINHRNGPRFHYPDPVDDAQRAVRYVRRNAKELGIDADRIGAVGYSSGGHLSLMLGVLDGAGDPRDPDPVNRESARVQCVVASAAPSDLAQMDAPVGTAAVVSFMAQLRPVGNAPDPVAVKAYRAASPLTHVSSSAAPMLLLHGDADQTVPFRQSELMEAAMKKAGAEVKLIRLAGGSHGFAGESAKNPGWPDFLAESVRWLDSHLRAGRGSR